MTFMDSFADLLTQEVTIETAEDEDEWGRVTFSAPVTWRCRIRPTRRAMYRAEGVEVVDTVTVLFLGNPTMTVRDRITYPDGQRPKVVSVQTIYDETGPIAQRATLEG